MDATIFVSGSFDDLRAGHFRFLDEVSRLGRVHLLLWSDTMVTAHSGEPPKFPQAERQYLCEAVRYVSRVSLIENLDSPDVLPLNVAQQSNGWAMLAGEDTPARRDFCRANGLDCIAIPAGRLDGFPLHPSQRNPERKKVIVSGCYDWLHSGHVRFFEECAQLGDLYVAVGNDANVRHLKGEGHPLFSQDQRRYLVQSIRYVTEAQITLGWDWLDYAPNIELLKPDIFVVNEDGDRPEKRAFCQEHGLEYVVLKRLPKEGLPRRESTKLRGF
jgi:cytidyltransferase-like protein